MYFGKKTHLIPLKVSHSSGASSVTGLINNGVGGIILLVYTYRVIRNDFRGFNNFYFFLQM